MRVAIAHDYLTQLGGAERVVLSLLKAFPQAPVYTTLYEPEATFPEFADADVRVGPLNRIGPLRRHHRAALPLLARAADRMHIDADLVIASSSGWAHGFGTTGRKLVYCHSPARWLYLSQDYLGGRRARLARALDALTPGLRRWDQRAAHGADRYLANSHVVQERIKQVYGIDAGLLFPPHRVDLAGDRVRPAALAARGWTDHHLLVSRLLPYKHVDAAIEAFAQLPDERLVVVGRGPLAARLRAAAGPNVLLLEGVSDAELRWLYARARALVAPSHEDFGLTVLEAAAFGTPAVALRRGGYLDTVREGVSGVFVEQPTATAIAETRRIATASCSSGVSAPYVEGGAWPCLIASLSERTVHRRWASPSSTSLRSKRRQPAQARHPNVPRLRRRR